MPGKFSTIVYKRANFCDFICIPAHESPPEKGSTLQGKNLLPWGANSFLLE